MSTSDYEPSRHPLFLNNTPSLSGPKTNVQWSDSYATDKQYQLAVKGPLASLARSQEYLYAEREEECSNNEPDLYYKHYESELASKDLELFGSMPVQGYKRFSLCSTILPPSLEGSPISPKTPESTVSEYQIPQEESLISEQKSKWPSGSGSMLLSTVSTTPLSKHSEIRSPSYHSELACLPTETLKDVFPSTLRVRKSLVQEHLIPELNVFEFDDIGEDSLCLGIDGLSFASDHMRETYESSNSISNVDYYFPSTSQAVPKDLPSPRKTFATQTSTSPFIKKRIYEPQYINMAAYQGTQHQLQVPRYLIGELRRFIG